MIRFGHKTGWCLALVLICNLFPTSTFADDESREKTVRLYAIEAFSPIGTIYSLSPFSLDGRRVFGEQSIWGGELIRGSAESAINVRVDSVGRVVLKPATVARLAATRTGLDDVTHPLLVASLVDGDMAVKLEPEASAYIESCGSAFTSSQGASFAIRIREGQPMIDIASGTVVVEPQSPSLRFKGRSVQVSTTILTGPPPPIPPGADTVDTSTKSRKRVVVYWAKSVPQTSSVTRAFSLQYVAFQDPAPQKVAPAAAANPATQFEVPAAGRKVHFEVEPTIGTISPTDAVTDANGFVAVDFIAGPNPGTGTIRARVLRDPGDPPNTDYEEYTRKVIVRKTPVMKTRKFQLGAAAAAIVVISHPWNHGPIKQQPPPVIQP